MANQGPIETAVKRSSEKRAIITGITGQDGAWLAQQLLDDGYRVFGAFRRGAHPNRSNLSSLGIEEKLEYVPFDMLEQSNMMRVIEQVRPDEIYNLAAQSFVGISFDHPIVTMEINAVGVVRLLESVRSVKPDTRIYQASTSEMFGKVRATPQDERTPFYPRSPYGVSKLAAHWAIVNYRESYGMYACAGILFNHESELRGLEFVTRKITQAVARYSRGHREPLALGNLDAVRDWGYAPDYVAAMRLMLRRKEAEDFVIATGEGHSVREWASMAYGVIGVDLVWQGTGVDEIGIDRRTGKTVLRVDPAFFRPAEVDALLGDSSRARQLLDWKPRVGFHEMITRMVNADIEGIAVQDRKIAAARA